MSYFTSLSFYILLLFGLRGLFELVFREGVVDEGEMMRRQMMNPMAMGANPMGFDAEAAFKQERAALAQVRWGAQRVARSVSHSILGAFPTDCKARVRGRGRGRGLDYGSVVSNPSERDLHARAPASSTPFGAGAGSASGCCWHLWQLVASMPQHAGDRPLTCWDWDARALRCAAGGARVGAGGRGGARGGGAAADSGRRQGAHGSEVGRRRAAAWQWQWRPLACASLDSTQASQDKLFQAFLRTREVPTVR